MASYHQHLLTFVLNVVGRIICSVLGLGLMIAGIAITISVVGAPIGTPCLAWSFAFDTRGFLSRSRGLSLGWFLFSLCTLSFRLEAHRLLEVGQRRA